MNFDTRTGSGTREIFLRAYIKSLICLKNIKRTDVLYDCVEVFDLAFKYVAIFSILAAGGFGGGIHYYQNNGLPAFLQSDTKIAYVNAEPFRAACKRDFARYITNREALDLNSSCVCFGTTVARLQKADQKSVLKALKDKARMMRPGGQSSGHITINTPEIASDVYRKCDMRPRPGEMMRSMSPG